MGLTKTLSDPNIRKHLLRDEGEVIVDEVMHHWIVYVVPILEVVLALVLLIAFPFIDIDLAWFPFLLRSEEHTSELQSLTRISSPVFCLQNKSSQLIAQTK